METTIEITLIEQKETKNCVRYSAEPEPGKPLAVDTLYVQKWALPSPRPRQITLKIELGNGTQPA